MGSIVISGIVRITSDAEIKKVDMGTFYSFGVAAYRKFVSKGKQDVDFFNASIFTKNPTAELEASLKKGQLMFIEGGNLLNEKFTGKDGIEKTKIKLKILSYEFFNPAEKPKEIIVPVESKPTQAKQEIIPAEDEPSDEDEAPF